MKRRVQIAVPVSLLVLIAVVYVAVFHRAEDACKLIISGNIEVIDAQLSFKIPGRLLERLVDEGERVAEGRLIARLESADQEIQVAQAEANLAYARAVLAELEAGSRPEEVSRARAQVEQARAKLQELESGSRSQEIANAQAELQRALAGEEAARAQLELAESDYRRYTDLYNDGVISTREYEAARTQYELAESGYEEAQARVSSAREALSLVEEGARAEQINQAGAALRQAEASYELVVGGPREETIEQARARVRVAVETVRQAEQQLEYTRLVAPFAGVVLSKAAEPGEYLNPGSPVVTIGQLDRVYLRAYVNETDLGRVRLGQRVEVTTDTYPGKVYDGVISFVSSEAEFTPKAVQTLEERVKLVYMVKIDLDNPDQELKPGMPADCVIDLRQE